MTEHFDSLEDTSVSYNAGVQQSTAYLTINREIKPDTFPNHLSKHIQSHFMADEEINIEKKKICNQFILINKA